MATTPFYLQQFRFLDDSPASGGRLYAFLQGTETPAAVYLDASMTTTAPNPIILGADGVVPQFFVPPINGYAFRLTDPRNGVETTVWTRDYIATSGGGGAPGVVSVALDPPALMVVTGSPIASSGTLVMEWSGDSSQMVRADGSTVAESSFAKAASYLPLAGGSMAPTAQITFPGQPNVGGYYGAYWQAPDCWSRVSHWGAIWSPSAEPAGLRGGVDLAPNTAGASLNLKSPYGQPGVELYTHEHGGYVRYIDFTRGPKVELGSHPSGYGEAIFRNSVGDVMITLSASDGEIRARSICTGASAYDVAERITPAGAGYLTSLRTGPDQYSMVERINGLGAGYLTALSISGLTNGNIPRVTSGGGLLGASCWGDNGTLASCARPLTLAGATRLPWQPGHQAFQFGAISALWEDPAGARFGRGCYFDGSGFRCANSTNYPVLFTLGDAGGFTLSTSETPPVADAPITDLFHKLQASRAGGVGFFGAPAPTVRPAINAACTDLATCIALTNQLRAAMVGCGLVQ